MTRIVITDDSALARMFVRRCLEIVGPEEAEFIEVSDGQQALEVALTSDVDLIITDLTMPNMDGVELVCNLKEDPSTRDIPVLVITSAGNASQCEEIRARGARILTKPITPPMVIEALEELMPAAS